ncbi:hypothetical protein [Salinibacter altiplanensis]|uniref:hypothetical protein n=1 Tax=Salinibacter altiplanensis TaxID=1803181 RepID=UPI0012FFE087|nr:hypothetical protein [Salinibacter altiplanensis]
MFEDICDLHQKGACYATDQHFGQQYGVHEKTAGRWRRELQEHGYLRRQPDGDRMLLIPNHKIVGEEGNRGDHENVGQEQNRGQRTESFEQNRGQTTNSSPRNRGTQRDKYTPEGCEGAPAQEVDVKENTEAPVTMERAIQIGEMVGVSERLCREWWLYYDEKGWPNEVKKVPSALRRWKMNDSKFDSSGSGDGAPAGGKSHTDRFGDQDVVHFGDL